MNENGVLVVGAGPTGLTLAVELARRDVPVTIIDRAAEHFVGSRGKGLQPRSLEVFDDLGVLAEILAWSWGGTTRHYAPGQPPVDAELRGFGPPRPDVPQPVGRVIPQWRVEQVLRERLAELGGAVELATELVEFAQHADGVSALVRGPAGERRLDVAYLVGCDGGRSTVRKALDVRFDGETAADSAMLIGDVEVTGLRSDRWHVWTSERGVFALCPFAGESSWQVQAATGDRKLPEPSLAVFRQLYDELAGVPGVTLANPTWMSTYRVNVRMVDRMRVGRVFLAGDAAHVHSPAGGLGMNTGIQDAYNLGWKLALVLAGPADAGLLDSYDEERLAVARWTLSTSNERLRVMGEEMRSGRNGFGLRSGDTSQLGIGYRFGSRSVRLADRAEDMLAAGDRAPDAPGLAGERGSPVRLFDVFRRPEFTLLGFGEAAVPALRAVGGAAWLHTCAVLPAAVGVEVDQVDGVDQVVVDRDGHAGRAYGVGGNGEGLLVLVRPDGYVGLIGGPHDHPAVLSYLRPLSRTTAP